MPLDDFKIIIFEVHDSGICLSGELYFLSLPLLFPFLNGSLGMLVSTRICVLLRSETQAGAPTSCRSAPLTAIFGNQK